jgi:hypothetical protein
LQPVVTVRACESARSAPARIPGSGLTQ